jgi:hypothetical protein
MDFFRSKSKKPNLTSFEPPETLPGPYGNQTGYILALHTITTILSMIQSPEVTNTKVAEKLTKPQCKELRVLDSLAFLANRQHEIVATVSATQISSSGGSTTIQVILSIINLIDSESALTSSQNSEKTWFQWVLSMNPCCDAPKFPPTPQDEMKLKDPGASISSTLKKLKSGAPTKPSNQKLLDAYLLTKW